MFFRQVQYSPARMGLNGTMAQFPNVYLYLCICVFVYCVFVYFCGGADSYQVECSPAGMGLDGTISIEMKLQKLNSGSESGVQ